MWNADSIMPQPTPVITAGDVDRIVRRDYAENLRVEAMEILQQYNGGDEPHRVRVAILKLAAGNIGALRQHLETAVCDYRDVIAPAEYPGYLKLCFSRSRSEIPQQIIERDWKQYNDWLRIP